MCYACYLRVLAHLTSVRKGQLAQQASAVLHRIVVDREAHRACWNI